MVLIGANGLGKTMLLKNLAYQAVLKGCTARFTLASDMLHDLAAQDSSTALARRLRRYTSPAILAIDEVGYLSYDARYADLLFEVVTRRYELRRPILLTTNKVFGEWNQVFPNAACVVTLIDRLVHRAEIVALEGKSYRLKEAQERSRAQSQIPQPSRAQGALERHAATQRFAAGVSAHRSVRRGRRQASWSSCTSSPKRSSATTSHNCAATTAPLTSLDPIPISTSGRASSDPPF